MVGQHWCYFFFAPFCRFSCDFICLRSSAYIVMAQFFLVLPRIFSLLIRLPTNLVKMLLLLHFYRALSLNFLAKIAPIPSRFFLSSVFFSRVGRRDYILQKVLTIIAQFSRNLIRAVFPSEEWIKMRFTVLMCVNFLFLVSVAAGVIIVGAQNRQMNNTRNRPTAYFRSALRMLNGITARKSTLTAKSWQRTDSTLTYGSLSFPLWQNEDAITQSHSIQSHVSVFLRSTHCHNVFLFLPLLYVQHFHFVNATFRFHLVAPPCPCVYLAWNRVWMLSLSLMYLF